MGDQTLSLARELSAGTPTGNGTLLFADIAGRQLIMLPAVVGYGLLGVLVVAFAAISFRRGGLWRGLAIVVVGIIIGAALAWAGTFFMGVARPGSFWRAYPLWIHLAVYACGLLGPVAALALIGRRLTVQQLRASFWLAFLLLGVAIFFIAPGGVIYFLLPPLVALIGSLVKQERIGAILAAVLLWLTFGEILALLGDLLNNGPFFILAPLALIIAMPWLIEAKELIGKPAIAPAAALMLVGWAAVAAAPAYSADRQQRFLIQHATDTGTGKAYWSVVNDRARLPDNYGNVAGWQRGELPHIEGKRWLAPAAALADLAPPKLQLLGNSRSGDLRTVTFRLETNGAETTFLEGPKNAQIVSAGSGNFVRPIAPDTKGEYYFSCFGRSCDGAELQFTTRSSKPIAFTLIGMRRGLPATAKPLLEQRPRFARPQYSPDATLTISRVAL
jgi:hypothetical protein